MSETVEQPEAVNGWKRRPNYKSLIGNICDALDVLEPTVERLKLADLSRDAGEAFAYVCSAVAVLTEALKNLSYIHE